MGRLPAKLSSEEQLARASTLNVRTFWSISPPSSLKPFLRGQFVAAPIAGGPALKPSRRFAAVSLPGPYNVGLLRQQSVRASGVSDPVARPSSAAARAPRHHAWCPRVRFGPPTRRFSSKARGRRGVPPQRGRKKPRGLTRQRRAVAAPRWG